MDDKMEIVQESVSSENKHNFQLIPTTTISLNSIKRPTKKSTQIWVKKPLKFGSRSDSINISHWERTNSPWKKNPFDELNIKNDVLLYTNEEYNLFIEPMDRTWTRESTDELFDLCDHFDLRFHVIADRFSDKSLTTEDLKKRYYSIARAIAEYRLHYLKKTELGHHSVMKTTYDYESDIRQKKMLEMMSTRTPQDEIDDAQVLEKLKIIEQIKAERAKEKFKRKREETTAEQCVAPEDNPDKIRELILPNMSALKQGVYPVSHLYQKQFTSSPTLNRRVEIILNEYSDKCDIRVVPHATEKILIQNEILRQKILHLIDMQKKVTRKESNMHFIQ